MFSRQSDNFLTSLSSGNTRNQTINFVELMHRRLRILWLRNGCHKSTSLVRSWLHEYNFQVFIDHKNLALFITHGGMGSTQETALRGVPGKIEWLCKDIGCFVGIFVPIFGDQPRNAGMMQFNGLGQVYDKFELHNGEKLASTIKEVLENKKLVNYC